MDTTSIFLIGFIAGLAVGFILVISLYRERRLRKPPGYYIDKIGRRIYYDDEDLYF